LERPEGQAKTIRSWESSAFVKPSHGEHKNIRSKVDRTLCGSRENEAGRLQIIRHPRESPRTFMECRKSLLFLYLSENCKQMSREPQMSLHSSASIAHVFLRDRTLFLTGETRKGVRFLMRWSLCTLKLQQSFVPKKLQVKAQLKQLTMLTENLTSLSCKTSEP
jgi:hypothetical protein